MTFTQTNIWTPGDLLTASQINTIDSNIVNAFDIRDGETNTVASDSSFTGDNSFSGTNTFSAVNVNSTLNIASDPNYSNPPSKTIFLDAGKFRYWYTTALTTVPISGEVLNYTESAKQTIIDKTVDSEQSLIAIPGVPYLKINYWNQALLKEKIHQYVMDLSQVGEGDTITDITIHYQPYGYTYEPINDGERIRFAVHKSAVIGSIDNITTAAASIHGNAYYDNATYLTSTKYNLSLGTISHTKSNVSSYILSVLTGEYSSGGNTGTMLIYGASVTYTKLTLQ